MSIPTVRAYCPYCGAAGWYVRPTRTGVSELISVAYACGWSVAVREKTHRGNFTGRYETTSSGSCGDRPDLRHSAATSAEIEQENLALKFLLGVS